jgi:hypothetical protein
MGNNKLAHYQAWSDAWLRIEPSPLPLEECLAIIQEQGPQWLQGTDGTAESAKEQMEVVVACFKTAAKARAIKLGGEVPPSQDAWDVLSESYDARVPCDCAGLFPVPATLAAADLAACGCRSIERMMIEAEQANRHEREWNRSDFFSAQGLIAATSELALCHGDIQAPPVSCRGGHAQGDWPEVQAPDRKPNPEVDLDEETYNSLFPTQERIRLSADAKHFYAIASGASLVDLGIQRAIMDSGNDVLIGDYCEAATEEGLAFLQKVGAAAFAFLKVCVFAESMTEWSFNQLVAQTIQFRVIGYYRDHAHSRRPKGVYGSRMTGWGVHRHIDLGITVGIVSAGMATGTTMTEAEYHELIETLALINDLVDFRGDTWRNQRENVVLRGTHSPDDADADPESCLCTYLDTLVARLITGATALIRRGKIFALNIMCFCNWSLMGSGHKIYEILDGVAAASASRAGDTRTAPPPPRCPYPRSQADASCYAQLLAALEPYGTLGSAGPGARETRKSLQLSYARYREAPDTHIHWLADVVRALLHPDILRQLVDVVHYPWSGELGNVGYCA